MIEPSVEGEAALGRDRRPVWALVVATGLSRVGSVITAIALPWLVLETTGSAGRAGLVGFAVLVPSLIAGIFGGALVDRLGFRTTSVATDLISALAIGAIPLSYATSGLRFWQLLLLVFVGGLMSIPGLSARRSMLPDLAHLAGMRIERVNALYEGCVQLSFVIGGPIAGGLVAIFGASRVLWIDAVSFLVSAIAVAVWVPGRARGLASPSYLRSLREGLGFLRGEPLLRWLAIGLFISNAFTNPLFAVVLPVFAKDRLGDAAQLGVLVALFGAGSLIGVLAYPRLPARWSRRWLWVVAFAVFPSVYLALALDAGFLAMAALLFVNGAIGGPTNPLSVTIRHQRTPAELRGRVFSSFSAVAMAAAPVGVAVSGAMIDRFGFEATCAVLGAACVVVGVGSALVPAYRLMDGPPGSFGSTGRA